MIARFGPQIGAVVIDIFKYAEEQRRLLGCKPLICCATRTRHRAGDQATHAGAAGDRRTPAVERCAARGLLGAPQ
jgi:hypothetical protein